MGIQEDNDSTLGNLDVALSTLADNVKGQQTMTNSKPVVIASDQSRINVQQGGSSYLSQRLYAISTQQNFTFTNTLIRAIIISDAPVQLFLNSGANNPIFLNANTPLILETSISQIFFNLQNALDQGCIITISGWF